MSIENVEYTDELGLSDRGVGVQATGFAVIGCISVAILHIFSGSDHLLYLWFEMAATRLYWAFVVPLAAVFDWGRIMFAKGKAIRETKKREILAKATQEARHQAMQQGLQQGIQKGVKEERAKMLAWAKERGIPESDLPFEDLDD